MTSPRRQLDHDSVIKVFAFIGHVAAEMDGNFFVYQDGWSDKRVADEVTREGNLNIDKINPKTVARIRVEHYGSFRSDQPHMTATKQLMDELHGLLTQQQVRLEMINSRLKRVERLYDVNNGARENGHVHANPTPTLPSL